MSIDLIERANRSLQRLNPDEIDFTKYLSREERARVISSEQIAEEGKKQMLLGVENDEGLVLPWVKAQNKVLITRGKLALWTGWSFHGKSQMLKHVMTHALSLSEKVCIASMEEEIIDIWKAMGIIACGTATPNKKAIDSWIRMSGKNLWFYDQQGTIKSKQILAVIRYAAEELGVTQFVIDSLMMLAVSRDDYDAQSVFTGELKTMAKDTGTTIHLVAHMRKRDGKTGEESPGSPHDIAGGHEIASKSDYIFNVWRDKAKTGSDPCILGVDKQRGRIDWIGKIGLGFDPSSRQYLEGSPIRYCEDEINI